EMGDVAALRRVSEAYLAKHEAWEPPTRFEDWGLARDPTARMLAALRRAGSLTQEQERSRRDDRLAFWEKNLDPALRSFLWIHFYATPAETAEEAKAAVSARSRFLPLTPFAPGVPAWAEVGRTYFLAGNVDEAIPILEHATKSCMILRYPVETIRAHYFLG